MRPSDADVKKARELMSCPSGIRSLARERILNSIAQALADARADGIRAVDEIVKTSCSDAYWAAEDAILALLDDKKETL